MCALVTPEEVHAELQPDFHSMVIALRVGHGFEVTLLDFLVFLIVPIGHIVKVENLLGDSEWAEEFLS